MTGRTLDKETRTKQGVSQQVRNLEDEDEELAKANKRDIETAPENDQEKGWDKEQRNNQWLAELDYISGEIAIKTEDWQQSKQFLGRALALMENVSGPEHASLVPILKEYAYVLEKLGEPNEAIKLRERAKEIAQ